MSRIKNLVTAEWLINNIALDNLKICDATYFLPTHNRDAEEEYVKEVAKKTSHGHGRIDLSKHKLVNNKVVSK